MLANYNSNQRSGCKLCSVNIGYCAYQLALPPALSAVAESKSEKASHFSLMSSCSGVIFLAALASIREREGTSRIPSMKGEEKSLDIEVGKLNEERA